MIVIITNTWAGCLLLCIHGIQSCFSEHPFLNRKFS